MPYIEFDLGSRIVNSPRPVYRGEGWVPVKASNRRRGRACRIAIQMSRYQPRVYNTYPVKTELPCSMRVRSVPRQGEVEYTLRWLASDRIDCVVAVIFADSVGRSLVGTGTSSLTALQRIQPQRLCRERTHDVKCVPYFSCVNALNAYYMRRIMQPASPLSCVNEGMNE